MISSLKKSEMMRSVASAASMIRRFSFGVRDNEILAVRRDAGERLAGGLSVSLALC